MRAVEGWRADPGSHLGIAFPLEDGSQAGRVFRGSRPRHGHLRCLVGETERRRELGPLRPTLGALSRGHHLRRHLPASADADRSGAAMNESEIIARLRRKFPRIGDDAAVIGDQVITTDMLIEDVDFTRVIPTPLIARKSLAANLSDLAAMGAR